MEAKTIHRLLEADPRNSGFKRCDTNPLACYLLVVDEVSMMDVPLMASLIRALPPQAGLLLVGDADQLPSVGPGQVLADIISSAVAPTALLTEAFRQAAQGRIVVNAHRINRGQMPELNNQSEEGLDSIGSRPMKLTTQLTRSSSSYTAASRHGSASTRCARCKCSAQ